MNPYKFTLRNSLKLSDVEYVGNSLLALFDRLTQIVIVSSDDIPVILLTVDPENNLSSSSWAYDRSIDISSYNLIGKIIIEEQYLGKIYKNQSNIRISDDLIISSISKTIQENVRRNSLCDETLDRYRELNLLYQISSLIGICYDINKLAKLTLEQVVKSLGVDAGLIHIYQSFLGSYEVKYIVGPDSVFRKSALDDAGFNDHELPIIQNQMDFFMGADKKEVQKSSTIIVPLTYKSENLGKIILVKFEPEFFNSGHQKILISASVQIAIAISNARVVIELDQLKEHLLNKNVALVNKNKGLRIVHNSWNNYIPVSSRMTKYVFGQQNNMVRLLENLVNIQSGSHNRSGLIDMGNYLRLHYEKLKFVEINHSSPEPHIIFESPGIKKGKPIVLSGHIDTVFPENTTFREFNYGEVKSKGPGVIDMKGGIVVFLSALYALNQFGLLGDIPIRVIHECDEELGSPDSKTLFPLYVSDSKFAIVGEASGISGQLVTQRRGAAVINIRVLGRAAHSGSETGAGVSAIEEIMFKINLMTRLNNSAIGNSVNIGQIDGGLSVNTVASEASCRISVRFNVPEEGMVLIERIKEITQESYIGNTKGEFNLEVYIPPMSRSNDVVELFDKCKAIGSLLVQDINEEFRGGASSACHISALGIPVIDGFGPRGGNDHTHEEYIYNESLVERTNLLAHTLLILGNQ